MSVTKAAKCNNMLVFINSNGRELNGYLTIFNSKPTDCSNIWAFLNKEGVKRI